MVTSFDCGKLFVHPIKSRMRLYCAAKQRIANQATNEGELQDRGNHRLIADRVKYAENWPLMQRETDSMQNA
jgi:hypothetical protein